MTTRHALVLTVLMLAAACGSDTSGPGTSTDTTVAAVVVTGASGASTTLLPGVTSQLSAAATNAAGATLTGKSFAWSSSNTGVATVSADGLVTALAPGMSTVSAVSEGKTGTHSVVVNSVPVQGPATVTISGSLSAQVGQTSQLSAVVKDGSGAVLTDVPVAWTSSDAALIGVDASTGIVTPVRIGSVSITATAGGKSSTVTFNSALAPYTFNFSPTTSAADQQIIRDGVLYGTAFQKATFTLGIQAPTVITTATTAPGCNNGGSAAFTGAGTIVFCVGNPGWLNNGPVSREKIVQHELFHVWQFENRWIGTPASGATWIIEGAAELMGYRGLAARNILPIGTTIGCMVKQVADFAMQQPPGLPPLIQVESAQSFQTTVGPLYAQSLLAVDQLTATQGLSALQTYTTSIAAGTQFPVAFSNAFGTTLNNFYAQFPAYRAAQPVPPNYQCAL